MKYVYKRIAQYPKKHKCTRVRFEHQLGCNTYMQFIVYGVDFPTALSMFMKVLDLKIGLVKITALYGESRICESTFRVSELLDNHAAGELLLC